MQESRKLSKTKHITILPFNSCHVYFFLLHPAFVHFVRSFSRLLYHSCLLFFLFFLSLYLLVSPLVLTIVCADFLASYVLCVFFLF